VFVHPFPRRFVTETTGNNSGCHDFPPPPPNPASASLFNRRSHSGKIKEGGPSLSHLVTDKMYRFHCEEVLEEVTGTGKETRTLYLVDFNLI
ncbi:MAG: hypothetical protein P9L99_01925, partial [Candidatus Lernaella stagnicola]|nr:hypothetical protein [Candidatus Lernaella stagnicola]